jgi:hypothetical protein
VRVQYLGGPTAILEIGGVRLLTDPTFDPPGEYPIGERMLTKTRGPESKTLRTPEGLEIGVDVEAMLGRADSGDLGDDLSDLFVALGEAAAEHGTGIVFLLDEVQFLDCAELEALIAALHQVSQRELPLTLAGAGLPQLPALPGAAKSYAERLFRFPTIDRLGEQAARDALELPPEQKASPTNAPPPTASSP